MLIECLHGCWPVGLCEERGKTCDRRTHMNIVHEKTRQIRECQRVGYALTALIDCLQGEKEIPGFIYSLFFMFNSCSTRGFTCALDLSTRRRPSVLSAALAVHIDPSHRRSTAVFRSGEEKTLKKHMHLCVVRDKVAFSFDFVYVIFIVWVLSQSRFFPPHMRFFLNFVELFEI